MKEYLRSDGEGISIAYIPPYTSSTGTPLYTSSSAVDVTSIIYSVLDLASNEYIQYDEAVLVSNRLFNIPLSVDTCKYDRDLRIELQIISHHTYTEDSIDVKLIRPYATAEEIASDLGFTITANPSGSKEYKKEQLEKIERKARALINAKINDDFYFYYKTVGTFGQDTDILVLGERIESFDKIIENDNIIFDSISENLVESSMPLAISKSKQSLKVVAPGIDIMEWADVKPIPGNAFFAKTYSYIVSGEFGWKYVPSEIKEATIELVNDILCSDFSYRNKGLKSIKNDSFDIQFQDGMMNGTGNVLVDSLIAPFKRFEIRAI